MNEAVRGVVVAHADLAAALIDAAERITGVQGAVVPLSNNGLGAEQLRDRLRELCTPGPAVVFVDLAAGSCAMAGLGLNRTVADVGVVTGASLPMLVDFVFHLDMDVDSLVERLVEKGRAGIAGHGCRVDDTGTLGPEGPGRDG
ncbi:MAG: hypothetical protein OEU54_06370 [Gemmatimonadota bacterium]|nr:hypothetical protein [Gemmatimonadota bacterium]